MHDDVAVLCPHLLWYLCVVIKVGAVAEFEASPPGVIGEARSDDLEGLHVPVGDLPGLVELADRLEHARRDYAEPEEPDVGQLPLLGRLPAEERRVPDGAPRAPPCHIWFVLPDSVNGRRS